jgi:hypothetical protein
VTNPLRRLLPRDSRRGRVARQALGALRLGPDVGYRRALARHIRDVEPTQFLPQVDWEPVPGEPLFSVLVPCFNTPARYLTPLVASVLAQTFGDWELVLADASTEREASARIAAAAGTDERVRYLRLSENGGISRNTNAALSAACGQFVAFLDHDDLLSPHALNEAGTVVTSDPDTDIIYSDEDLVSENGKIRSTPFFKADWSPHMFLEVNYTNHLSVVRRSLIEKAGGLRPEFDGAQDYDLLLRLHSAQPVPRVAHIRKILYHWREAKTSTAWGFSAKAYALEAGQQALAKHAQRLDVETAGVTPVPGLPGWYNLRPRRQGKAVVLVQTGAGAAQNARLADLVKARTDCGWVRPEFHVLAPDERVGGWTAPAEAVAVVAIQEPYLPQDPQWLDELAGVLALPETACVAPLLMREPDRVVSAGLMRCGDSFERLFSGFVAGRGDLRGPSDMVRDVDALDAAVVAVRPEHVAWLGRATVQPPPDSGRAVMWGHQRFVRG